MSVRSKELDSMGLDAKKADILKNIKANGAIRITTRKQMSFWVKAINSLESDNVVHTEFTEREQESFLTVTMPLESKETA